MRKKKVALIALLMSLGLFTSGCSVAGIKIIEKIDHEIEDVEGLQDNVFAIEDYVFELGEVRLYAKEDVDVFSKPGGQGTQIGVISQDKAINIAGIDKNKKEVLILNGNDYAYADLTKLTDVKPEDDKDIINKESANTDALEALMKKASNINLDEKTEDSAQQLQGVINEVNEYLAKTDKTQDEVDNLLDKLTDAITSLEDKKNEDITDEDVKEEPKEEPKDKPKDKPKEDVDDNEDEKQEIFYPATPDDVEYHEDTTFAKINKSAYTKQTIEVYAKMSDEDYADILEKERKVKVLSIGTNNMLRIEYDNGKVGYIPAESVKLNK